MVLVDRPGRDLIAAARAGSASDWTTLLEWLGRELLPLASALSAGSDGADELVSDTLSRVFERLPQLREPDSLLPWARRIMVRQNTDRFRALRRRHVRIDSVRLEAAGPPGHLLDLHQAMARLNANERAVVVLHYWLGLTLDQAAAEIGIPVGTARSRLHAALGKLRVELKERQ